MLESDGAVAAGRELYGQPKKHGQVSLEPDGDLLVGRVARNGIDVATATTVWKQRPAEGGELERLVPGLGRQREPAGAARGRAQMRRELVARTFADVVEHEAWVGPATLELRPNAQVPVHLLAVREVVLGLHRVLDLSLPPGHVIHRY